MYFITWTFLE